MNFHLLQKRYSSINIFIFIILILLGLSVFYFLYYRYKNQVEIYISLTLIKPRAVEGSNYTIPYWMSNAIQVGDKDINPFGKVEAAVIDKESYDDTGNGQRVYLIVKASVVRDRSGKYIMKNKPLSSGQIIKLELTSVPEVYGLVTFMDEKPPAFEYKKMTVVTKWRGIEKWTAENIKVGNTIVNNKKQIIARIIEKKDFPAEVRSDTAYGKAVVSYDQIKRDVEITIELRVRKINDSYYFFDEDKIKVNEKIVLPFKEVSIYPLVSSIIKTEEISE